MVEWCLVEAGEPSKSMPFVGRVMNAYELPIGTQITIGKRGWELVHRMKFHPDMMRFREVTVGEHEPIPRSMYPSEVQALIDAGFKVCLPEVTR
jgi:hypothetical protein